jgi:hypothetical protein
VASITLSGRRWQQFEDRLQQPRKTGSCGSRNSGAYAVRPRAAASGANLIQIALRVVFRHDTAKSLHQGIGERCSTMAPAQIAVFDESHLVRIALYRRSAPSGRSGGDEPPERVTCGEALSGAP